MSISGINLDFYFGGEVGWFCVPVDADMIIDLWEKQTSKCYCFDEVLGGVRGAGGASPALPPPGLNPCMRLSDDGPTPITMDA
jgi:hypothetical protein